MNNHDGYLLQLLTVLEKLRHERDTEQNQERKRALSITITDLEKLISFYEKYVVS